MGKTYAESFTANHAVAKPDLYILEHLEDKAELFRNQGYQNTFTSTGAWLADVDLIILAVKPQDAAKLYPVISENLNENHLVLSIMAGVTVSSIQKGLGIKKVVRAMPNLPAQVGMGMTGFTSDPSVGKVELFGIQNLLNTTGKSIYFEDEEMLNAVTAISGSGPAYVYYFMDAMIQAASKMGFTRTQAEVLTSQTFMGAVHLLSQNRLTCAEWINRVASKGGTTEAAIKSFTEDGLSQTIETGLRQALNRAVELGKE